MEKLADLVTDRRGAAFVVALVLIFSVVSVMLAGQVEREDDLLAFLPQDNPDIEHFQAINERFGGLDVAIVGVGVPDAYDPATLKRLRAASQAVQDLPAIDHVLSLVTVDDFTPDPMGGIRTGRLVESIPTSPEESAALRDAVAVRDQVRGTLVSDDGRALVIYAFSAYGADARTLATDIEREVTAAFPDADLYWGGSPFVSSWIYDSTQADVRRLTPWAVGAIVLIMLVAFRDWRGTLLGLGSTAVGIFTSQALMGVLGVPLNVVLGSMPIILFAVGSAYAIHMLARYQAHAAEYPCEEAVRLTVVRTGPTVLTAGLTTALGLLSFVVMDIEPMRVFGVFTAIGVVVTLTLSVTFVPAVIRLLELKPRAAAGPGPVARATMALTVSVQRHKGPATAALAALAVVGVVFTLRVDNRVDQSTFYNPGSPPDRADRFLAEHFGGSTFVQVLVEGDLSDPHALREVQRLGDQMRRVPGVHGVQHVADVVAVLNDAMESQARVPDTPAKVDQLFGLLTGNPAVRQLVTDDRSQALIHVRLNTSDLDEVGAALAEIERLAADATLLRYTVADTHGPDGAAAQARLRDLVAWRVLAVTAAVHPDLDPAVVRDALARRTEPAPGDAVEADLERFLRSDECFVALTDDEISVLAEVFSRNEPADEADRAMLAAGALAIAANRHDPSPAAFADDPRVGDLAWLLDAPLSESRLNRAAEARTQALLAELGVEVPAGTRGGRVRANVAAALLDLDAPTAAVPAPGAAPRLSVLVNGMPVLHRGLSTSTTRNQLLSLLFAMGLVAVVLAWRFGSLASGLLATAPMALALLVVYGGMGALGIHLDIGTAMLASIVIGAGVDYAVHLLSAWYAADGEPLDRGAARAAARTGPAIWTNALMVAAGFFVLTLGDARPLRNVGGLTSAAMLTAALTTFLVLPALARRRRYSPAVPARDPADGAALQAAALPSPAEA